jgi:hypothetical protein
VVKKQKIEEILCSRERGLKFKRGLNSSYLQIDTIAIIKEDQGSFILCVCVCACVCVYRREVSNKSKYNWNTCYVKHSFDK